MKNYVIVGNGVAAVGCIEGIRSVDSTGAITVVSEENSPAYCRPLISYYLEKKTTLEKMPYRPADFYEKNGCTVLYGQKAEKIDADTQTVLLSGGAALPYTSVCVATGSSPFVPPFAGLERVKNKFSFMTVEDTLALEKALSPNANVFIVGAGLIGLKCAEGIAKRVKSVTVCDLADRVLSSILDGECAALMQTRLEENGIAFMLGDTAVAFTENSATMKSGKKVEFDILVLAVGVRANTSLVKEAGGEVNRGIVVDTSMKTSLPSVYAAGDCTEGYDLSFGRTPRARHSPQRLYAGLHRRGEYGGRKKGVRQRNPHELHRIFRFARNDGRHVRGYHGRGEDGKFPQTVLYQGRQVVGIYPHRALRTGGHSHLPHSRKDSPFVGGFRLTHEGEHLARIQPRSPQKEIWHDRLIFFLDMIYKNKENVV